MLQLVYISTVRGVITQDMCENILMVSRRNNQAAGISGLLVAGQKRFLQALEGPTDAIRQIYARIVTDRRHYACVRLSERYIDAPQFGAWAMGYSAGCDAADGADLEAIVTALVEPLDDATLRAQFIGFAQLNARAA